MSAFACPCVRFYGVESGKHTPIIIQTKFEPNLTTVETMGLGEVNAESDEDRQWTPLLILVQDKERLSQSDRLSPTSPSSAGRFKIYGRWSEKRFCDRKVVKES